MQQQPNSNQQQQQQQPDQQQQQQQVQPDQTNVEIQAVDNQDYDLQRMQKLRNQQLQMQVGFFF